MKSVVILLAIISVCLGGRTTMTSYLQKKMTDDLMKTTLGRNLFTLVELHSAVGGPVEELLSAIEELIADLSEELNTLDFNFQARTNEHFSLTVTYQQDIQDADADVGRMDDLINSLLIPRRSAIKAKITAIQDNQAFNRKTLAEITLLREQGHADFEAQLEELNAATEAVDDAINLLSTLTNPSSSLIQLKKIKKSFARIQKKTWNRVKQGPMIEALVNLATTQNFSDQNMVKEIVGYLGEFRAEIINTLNYLTAQETENQADFEERVEQLTVEYHEFQSQINAATLDLDATKEKIDSSTLFRNQREQDRKTGIAQLNLENETYATETQIYTDLKNEYLAELSASETGLSLVQSADFSSIHL